MKIIVQPGEQLLHDGQSYGAGAEVEMDEAAVTALPARLYQVKPEPQVPIEPPAEPPAGSQADAPQGAAGQSGEARPSRTRKTKK